MRANHPANQGANNPQRDSTARNHTTQHRSFPSGKIRPTKPYSHDAGIHIHLTPKYRIPDFIVRF